MTPTTKPRTRSVILTPDEAREAAAGRLTEIRRPLKGSKPFKRDGLYEWYPGGKDAGFHAQNSDSATFDVPGGWAATWSPLGEPGTVLLGRETWGTISWVSLTSFGPPRIEVVYRAGPHSFGADLPHGWKSGKGRWRSGATMPLEHVRSRFTVTSVRVERVDGVWWWVAGVERIDDAKQGERP